MLDVIPCHVIWMQELESSVEGWPADLTSLFLLRDSLEGVVSADDITALQERLQLLQRQWGEVCHQVDAHSACLIFILRCFKRMRLDFFLHNLRLLSEIQTLI